MENLKITVFTPTYNRSYTLQRLFESLRRQSDKRFEWLICDDGSEDNTEEIIKQFIDQTDDFQIKYLKQQHGGKHIKFMCIIAAPEGVKRLHEAHPDVQIYVGHLDRELNENAYICPGLGDAGDRIFGTK